MANFSDVIKMFIEGEVEGSSSGQGNLKIKGNVLIHYFTPILERYNGKFILNNSRYSIVTGRLQKKIKEIIPKDKIIIVLKVPEGYKESLSNFIEN